MKPRLLSWIAQVTGGRLVGADRAIDAVATDTRALPQGGAPLFVALKGEQFDGHAHVQAAAIGGCIAALVAHAVDVDIPQVIVADTERALGDFAAAVQRERMTKVLAITGSNGKTSVKTLLHSILAELGAAYANPGNRNNEIGLPLAVLAAPDDAAFAVYEMGAGKPGDIAYLAAIAPPTVALVNNVAAAHLERMGSLQGVAETKGAIYDALPADGVAVVNADDAFALYFAERAHGRKLLRFGIDAHADVSARGVHAGLGGSRFTLVAPGGAVEITLPLPGLHNVRNALAAATMALAVGANLEQIRAGLEQSTPVAGRLVTHRLDDGTLLVDDSYNANPGSLAAAIAVLASAAGARWLVLGDMRELGVDAAALHARAGEQARQAGIERLYALGELSAHAVAAFGDGARSFDTHQTLTAAVLADLAAAKEPLSPITNHPSPITVLVKGSRGSAMDRVVRELLERGGGP
ncbi:MAG: UDP-N-acetylmuramoyl-tripeptide--D-alanyl-D-alanine ligase [Thermomonas sp.]|uniref:UDP-N-acetylmuramoyl-tripeptide--D-alanyl-D- alanine ligase n=1 Tax=Thermomonas sp. TaxID=1971895 RepID=UPI001D91983C|nr:UDP-N-acetylmuramoyl-tripeptide--D-alanyl-D-alanine ligase [Thermomonas sp.]MBZ0088544.1 UDP-N-acetylmuramoyl-tripeptide--D-alanyl-D-alanine ligase [Thermomonas sp.]